VDALVMELTVLTVHKGALRAISSRR